MIHVLLNQRFLSIANDIFCRLPPWLLLLFLWGSLAGCERPEQSETHGRVVQGYYASWEQEKFPPEIAGLEFLTHVSHAFVWPDAQGNLVVPPNFVLPRLNRMVHDLNGKILLCVGGGHGSKQFSAVAADSSARKRFVREIHEFVTNYCYDGVEIDWEFPRSDADKENLVVLMRDIRASLGSNFIVNLVVNGGKHLGPWIDVERIAPYVDYFAAMTYDYHGPWSEFSGHNAPLFPRAKSDGSVSEGIEYWLGRGVPTSKLLLGLAFYGRSFNSKTVGRKFTRSGHAHYRDIVALTTNGYTRYWDPVARVPCLLQENGPWIYCYDDAQSLRRKLDFAMEKNLAGVMIWHVTGDIVGGRHALLPVCRSAGL